MIKCAHQLLNCFDFQLISICFSFVHSKLVIEPQMTIFTPKFTPYHIENRCLSPQTILSDMSLNLFDRFCLNCLILYRLSLKTLNASPDSFVHFAKYDHLPRIRDFQSVETVCRCMLADFNCISESFCRTELLILVAYFKKLNLFLPTCS